MRRGLIVATAGAAVVVPALLAPTLPEWEEGRWGALLAGWLALAAVLGTVPIVSAVSLLRAPSAPSRWAVAVLLLQVVPPLAMLGYLLRSPADQAGIAFVFVPPLQLGLLLLFRLCTRPAGALPPAT